MEQTTFPVATIPRILRLVLKQSQMDVADMLRLRSFPNLEDHPLLAVRECLLLTYLLTYLLHGAESFLRS